MQCRFGVSHNVLALGAVADFGAQNCQYTTKVDARWSVQLTTSPAIEPNACACCTTQIYKNLHKKEIICKFIHARKEKFYPTVICFG
jgi:hypothetical protein